MDSNPVNGTIFRDVITAGLVAFMALVVLLISFIEIPEDSPSQGAILIELDYNYGYDTDVDLWARAPGDGKVGFLNKSGKIFNLLRDDRGDYGDITPYNHETMISRGIPDGRYTVNVHAYSNPEGKWPVECYVNIIIKGPNSVSPARIQRLVYLERPSQEITVVNFDIRNGRLDHSSLTSIFRPLYTERSVK